MKRFGFTALILFLASYAGAYPNVGDKVTWNGTMNMVDGTKEEIKITKEVLAFNKETRKWTVKYDADIGKDRTSKISEVEDLYSPEKYKEILASCVQKGGILEDITTSVGMYKTCKLTSIGSDGSIVEKWWGNLPFGVVSRKTQDASSQIAKRPDLNSILTGL
ncbi:hypothetical protein ACES2L_09680 [Bdellovibrio bacteriovorus]